MKKNDWILVIGVALYSFLFYQQSAGINFLLFNLAAILLLYLKQPERLKSKTWVAAAVGSTFTAACIVWYGNNLTFIANLLSLALLSCVSTTPRSSVFVGILFSLFSLLSSFIFMILDMVERTSKRPQQEGEAPAMQKGKSFGKTLLLILIPLLVVTLFFLLYKASNPVFDELTKEINLDFITVGWVFFTFTGLLVMYGFLYHRNIPYFSEKDTNASNNLRLKEPTLMDKWMSMANENKSGIILFSLLNLLILGLNVVDVNYLFLGAGLPEGMTYADLVHQGVGALIFSIIIAIGVILYYFRGRVNFYPKNKALKVLAYIWILQNVFLVVATAYRNQLYIDEFSLTHKRIGVYVYLSLTLIGLAITLIKIAKLKTNWFLIRTAGWSFYAVLVLSCAMNWNMLITNFNIQQAVAKNKVLDTDYLMELNDTNLPNLVRLYEQNQLTQDTYSYYGSRYNLEYRLARFINEWEASGWKSWCYDKQRVYDELMEMKIRGGLSDFDLSKEYYNDFFSELSYR